MNYKKGQKVRMTNDAIIDNYGEENQNKIFIITHCSNKYMPAKEFYERNSPEGFHPGYDESVYPDGLYDLKDAKTGESFSCSLYDWELTTPWNNPFIRNFVL